MCEEHKVYFGGLPYSADCEELRTHVEGCGYKVLDSVVINDRDSGKSKGFGFITFGCKGDAEQCVERLNQSTMNGRTIKVNHATARSETRGRGGYGGGQGRTGGGYQQRDNYGGGGGGRSGGSYGGDYSSGGGGGGYGNYSQGQGGGGGSYDSYSSGGGGGGYNQTGYSQGGGGYGAGQSYGSGGY